MLVTETDRIPDDLLVAVRQAKHVVVFTGAGVSAESGIPTFRDALTGLWNNFDAEMLATPRAFRRNPALVWGWYEWRRKQVMQTSPNAAHHAIARLRELVPQLTVITQNVDDLHERAGTADVIHLHGSLFVARCSGCARPYPLSAEEPTVEANGAVEPPRCQRCNGRIRPGVVWFGENLSSSLFSAARRAARSCDVLLSIGTSSEVYPAAAIPLEAARRRKTIIQINPEATQLDEVASFTLRGPAGASMQKLLAEAWPAKPG